MTSLITYRPPRTRSELDAAFAEFLRVGVANGDASEDTVYNCRNEVELWAVWCIEEGFDAARSAGLRPDNPAAGVKSPRVRHATEDFKYLCDEELAKLLSVIPDPEQTTGREKVRRLRNLLMISMMALQGLRTVEVQRANVEDLTEKGENLALLVRGKTRDRIVYLRPDTAERLKAYLALRGEVGRDQAGTPVFAALGNRAGGERLSRRHIRVQTDTYLRQAGLKRPGISNHALRHTAGTLGYLHTGGLRAVQELLGHADPRMRARYAHVVDMVKRNPALFIPVKVGGEMG